MDYCWDRMHRLTTMFSLVNVYRYRAPFIANGQAELPLGSKVISVTASGESRWVVSVRIEVRVSNEFTKVYFMKVCR